MWDNKMFQLAVRHADVVIKEIWVFLSEYLNDDGWVNICKTGMLDPSGDGGIPWRLPQIWKLFIKCGVD